MAGIFFAYEPGHIDVAFSQHLSDDCIQMRIKITGDITTTVERDDDGNFTEPQDYQDEDREFLVSMSSVFCPFNDLIAFLEAVTVDVKECGFQWEAEGPDGAMYWSRRFWQDTGFLTVEWHSSQAPFRHRVMLNTRQMVRAVYTAFRHFVDSDVYNPLCYEQLTDGESFEFVISNASLDELTKRLIAINRTQFISVYRRLIDAIGNVLDGPVVRHPIEYFFESSEVGEYSKGAEADVAVEWDSWDTGSKVDFIQKVYSWGNCNAFGSKLRFLRSKLVEDWLALPEPAQKRVDMPCFKKS